MLRLPLATCQRPILYLAISAAWVERGSWLPLPDDHCPTVWESSRGWGSKTDGQLEQLELGPGVQPDKTGLLEFFLATALLSSVTGENLLCFSLLLEDFTFFLLLPCKIHAAVGVSWNCCVTVKGLALQVLKRWTFHNSCHCNP